MLLRFFCSAKYAKRKTKTKSTKCKYYVIVVSTTWKPVFFFAMCVYIRLSRIHYMRICEALGWTLRIHSFYSYTHFCIWNTEKRECSTMKRALKQIRRANFCMQEQMQKNAYILFSLQFVTFSWFRWVNFCCCFVNRTIPLLIINFRREWKRIGFYMIKTKQHCFFLFVCV